MHRLATLVCVSSLAAWCLRPALGLAQDRLLNVSYDPTREMYHDVDQAFPIQWKAQTGHDVTITTSHAGSAAQASAVLQGLPADVVTLAVTPDIDVLAKQGILASDWATRLPNHACPYTSVAVLLVRRGNPKHIHDWGDLAGPGISVITPDPKTSGGARWNYLAALGWAKHQHGATEASAQAFMRALYGNVAILDAGSRGATNSFVQRGVGDVLIGGENEARLALGKFGGGGLQIIYPSMTILEEAPVAVVDSVVNRHGSRALAEAYLRYLWTPDGQDIAARHFFRPRDPAVLARYAANYPRVNTFDISVFGGWAAAQARYFGDGGLYEQMMAALPPRP